MLNPLRNSGGGVRHNADVDTAGQDDDLIWMSDFVHRAIRQLKSQRHKWSLTNQLNEFSRPHAIILSQAARPFHIMTAACA
jgi:hypothetical protein